MCYSALVKRELDYLGRKYGAVAVRTQIDDYKRESNKDPKRYPPLHDRIYPGHYAPVIFERDGKRVVEVMRYGAYPPPTIASSKKYTTFNARRDNLTSRFWSTAFMHQHGFIVLEGFYEWVSVNDLLKAGVVTLKEIERTFQRQAEERKAKLLAQGKKWKLTPTEQKDPRERQIIIEFRPEDGTDLIAPVIFSFGKTPSASVEAGFAIVTDDPPFEIEQAGHDRCPVILEPGVENQWMHFQGKSPEDLDLVLTQRRRVTFKHRLAKAS